MVEAIFLLCAISPGYMTSGLQEQYIKRLRRVAPFTYIKTLTRTAGGRPIVAIQLGCGCTKVLITGTHHANESITGTLLWELLLSYCKAICQDTAFGGIPARVLYRNSMLYCVPLVNPDGADLVAGEIPEASPEYVQAAAIAAGFPQIPFPDGIQIDEGDNVVQIFIHGIHLHHPTVLYQLLVGVRRHLPVLLQVRHVELVCLLQISLNVRGLMLIRIASAFGKYLDSIVDRRVMAGCHHQAIR